MSITVKKQIRNSIVIGAVSALLEMQLHADGITSFLVTNGLILILALFGLNCAASFQMLTNFQRMEEKENRGQFLDACRLSLLRGMKEQLYISAVFYTLILIASSSYLSNPTGCYEVISCVNFIIAALLRACLFQVAYCTYDHSKTAIESALARETLDQS